VSEGEREVVDEELVRRVEAKLRGLDLDVGGKA